MSARDLVMAAAGSAGDSKLYSDDVFSAYTYTGNGSTQTINNGIDLLGNGGMVWIKERSNIAGYGHWLFNTNSGPLQALKSHATSAQASEPNTLTAFNANGFSFGSSVVGNTAGATFVAWTFRKAPKFFDVVTYTGDGTGGRTIPHSLGAVPGLVVIKEVSAANNWAVSANHNAAIPSGGHSTGLSLNLSNNAWNTGANTLHSATTFAVTSIYAAGGTAFTNNAGVQYVAYLFAHDPSPTGLIQCGSFVGNGENPGTVVNLGWEPQYILVKSSFGGSDGNWRVFDTARGISAVDSPRIFANAINGEMSGPQINVSSTGFQVSTVSDPNTSGATYIYTAIRKPS